MGIQQESISLELSALHERSDNRSILDILKDESAKSNRKKRSALMYREGKNSKSCQTTRLTSLPICAESSINGNKIYAGIYFFEHNLAKHCCFANMIQCQYLPHMATETHQNIKHNSQQYTNIKWFHCEFSHDYNLECSKQLN